MAHASKTPAEAVEHYRGRTVRLLSCLTSAHTTVSGYHAADHPHRLLLARVDAARLHAEPSLTLLVTEQYEVRQNTAGWYVEIVGYLARSLRPAPVLVGNKGSARAPWLEPYGGDPDWRTQMWGQIVALHGRYPTQLEKLKENWWEEESQTEMLCALALWRAEIDDTGQDPREELAFQNQLNDYAQLLRGQGGGATKEWKPGPPPAEWAGE